MAGNVQQTAGHRLALMGEEGDWEDSPCFVAALERMRARSSSRQWQRGGKDGLKAVGIEGEDEISAATGHTLIPKLRDFATSSSRRLRVRLRHTARLRSA
jgi:hypothetical protein